MVEKVVYTNMDFTLCDHFYLISMWPCNSYDISKWRDERKCEKNFKKVKNNYELQIYRLYEKIKKNFTSPALNIDKANHVTHS